MGPNNRNGQYEILSPWAEADSVPLRGIAPRVMDLAGKRIGLFCDAKRAARPIVTVIEAKLKERFPTATISWYEERRLSGPPQIESERREEFVEWVKGVDAIVSAVGD